MTQPAKRVGHLVRALLPNPRVRRALLSALADSIGVADKVSPAAWGVTLTPSYLRLNVGPIEVLTIFEGGVGVGIAREFMRGLPARLRDEVTRGYSSVAGSKHIELANNDFARDFPKLREAHQALVESAAKRRSGYTWKEAHSPELLHYLRDTLRRTVPEPSWASTRLTDLAVYTIVHPNIVNGWLASGRTKLKHTENRRWVTAARLLAEAKSAGVHLPVIFSNAQHTTRLLAWGILHAIHVGAGATSIEFSDLRPLRGRRKQELLVPSTGEPIPDGHIRPYVIVERPDFVSAEAPVAPRDAPAPAEDEEADVYALEGAQSRRLVLHRQRERALRNRKLALHARKNGGRLVCEIPGCGFDFEAVYGELGRGMAFVHHLKPLGERRRAERTDLSDLMVICANCHAVVHQADVRAEDLVVRSGAGRQRATR